MHDIFISYSRRDTEMMTRVTNTLRDKGLTVWTDEGIKPGTQSWKSSLSQAILECKAVVVLFSPDSSQSTWVNRELDFAELHGKAIYPLLVSGEITESVPFGYTTYQFIDIRQATQFDEGMADLIESLSETLQKPLNPTPAKSSNTTKTNDEATLWKWLDFGHIHLTVPSYWKIASTSPEDMQRMQILMMGNDETMFYHAVEDFNSNFVYQATGIGWGDFDNICTMNSMSEMSPLAGFLGEYHTPVSTPGILMPAVMSVLKKRIIHFSRTRYRAEISNFEWKKSDTGRIWSYHWEFPSILEDTFGMKGKIYTIFPQFSRRSLFLSLICEETRFAKEQAHFDQIARSLHYVYD